MPKGKDQKATITRQELEKEITDTMVYNSTSCNVNLQNLRVTQLPSNRRQKVPTQQGQELEEQLRSLKSKLQQCTKNYMETECDEIGRIKREILDKEEKD